MIAKKKGIEIFHKHWDEGLSDRQAKECALISVGEIIKEYDEEILESNDVYRQQYWIEVRDYLNAL